MRSNERVVVGEGGDPETPHAPAFDNHLYFESPLTRSQPTWVAVEGDSKVCDSRLGSALGVSFF